jgi:hypothetical protein
LSFHKKANISMVSNKQQTIQAVYAQDDVDCCVCM